MQVGRPAPSYSRRTDAPRPSGEAPLVRRFDRWLLVGSPEKAERVGLRGSPTLLVDGVDPFATGDEPVGLACRVYLTSDGPRGAPTIEQIRAVLT